MNNSLRTELARAKGLGSAKAGAHHWWHQRLTSIIMVPLFIWLLLFIKSNTNQELSTVIANIHKPYNIVPMLLLIPTAFYHGMLGMRVIIEDYIPNVAVKSILTVSIQLFSIATIVSMIVALLSLISI